MKRRLAADALFICTCIAVVAYALHSFSSEHNTLHARNTALTTALSACQARSLPMTGCRWSERIPTETGFTLILVCDS